MSSNLSDERQIISLIIRLDIQYCRFGHISLMQLELAARAHSLSVFQTSYNGQSKVFSCTLRTLLL